MHRIDPFFVGAIVASGIMGGFGVGYATRGVPTIATPALLVSTSAPVAGAWRFEPKADMTNAELAMAMALMFNGPDFIPSVGKQVEALPPEFRRHWRAPVTTGQEQAK